MIIKPIRPEIGATVECAPDDVLADGAAQLLLAALDNFNVLVFPQLQMSDDTFLALTAALGQKQQGDQRRIGSEQ